VLTTVKCAVVRLRALVERHSARLISNHPIAGQPGLFSSRKISGWFLVKTKERLNINYNLSVFNTTFLMTGKDSAEKD
jgi:hypothetical protein